MVTTSQYSFKKLPTGKIEILENGVSTGQYGVDPGYAAQLGYKTSGQRFIEHEEEINDPAAQKIKTMGDLFKGGTKKSSSTTYSATTNDTQTRIDEIKNQLGVKQKELKEVQGAGYTGDYAEKDVKYDSSGKIIKAVDAYSDYSTYDKAQDQYTSGLDKINLDLTDAKAKQKSAYDSLGTLQTDLYNKTYAELGMAESKEKIAKMDSDIAAKKAERDKLVLDKEGKPIAQWLITGEVKQVVDRYDSEIGQLRDDRNAEAEKYNTNIDELEKKVTAGVNDAKIQAAYWDNQVLNLSNQANTYQAQLMGILKDTNVNSNKTEIVEANGRKLLVTYDKNGKKVNTEDLGAITYKPSSKTPETPEDKTNKVKNAIVTAIKSSLNAYKANPDGFRENYIAALVSQYGDAYKDYITQQVYAHLPSGVKKTGSGSNDLAEQIKSLADALGEE